jgi:hypothetical protein
MGCRSNSSGHSAPTPGDQIIRNSAEAAAFGGTSLRIASSMFVDVRGEAGRIAALGMGAKRAHAALRSLTMAVE